MHRIATHPMVPEQRLSRCAAWAGGEPIASILMAKTLGQPHLISLAAEEFLGPIGGIEWVRPSGGLYVWLRLPESLDTGLDGPLFPRALAEGVLYVPGEYCYPAEGQTRPRNMLRLSFGAVTCEELRQGVRALAAAICQVV